MASITSLPARRRRRRSAARPAGRRRCTAAVGRRAACCDGVTRAFGALRGDRRRLASPSRPGEKDGDPRLQRRRQDHAVQRHHRRLPADGRARPSSSAKTSPTLPPHERIRKGLAAHLPVLAAVSRPHGARQPVPRGARRRAAAASASAPRRAAPPLDASRRDDLLERVRLTHIADEPVAEPVARPAAPARDRHGAGRRAAPDPVRRAGRGPVARPSGASWWRCSPRCRRTWASC